MDSAKPIKSIVTISEDERVSELPMARGSSRAQSSGSSGESLVVPVRTGGEWFMRILQANGFQFLFGTTGGGMPDIQDAMTVVKPPKWIQGLHEFPTVCAAVGYALAGERPAICLIDRTVGPMNSLGGVYMGFESFAPVVIFGSRNYPGVQVASGSPQYHYHTTQTAFMREWCKWVHENQLLETLAEDVQKAIFTAAAEPQGPVYLTLREDTMAKRVDRGLIRSTKRMKPPELPVPRLEVLREAFELLLRAQNPLVVATSLGRHSEAVSALVKLAETLAVPVRDGRSFLNFPMEHYSFAGFQDFQSSWPRDCDLIFNIEHGYLPPTRPPEGAKVIDLTSDPFNVRGVVGGGDYGSTIFEADVRMLGDSRATLTALTELAVKLIDQRKLKETVEKRRAKLIEEHSRLMDDWRKEADEHLNDGPVSPYRIARELKATWSDRTVWVNVAITSRSALMRNIVINKPGSYFGNPSWHLGVACGMAYGVALARSEGYVNLQIKNGYPVGSISKPYENVICTIGDGEAIMGNIDSCLWTCSHYSIPVLYLVMNNASWGIEWEFIAKATGGWSLKAKNYECVDIDEPRINFAELARAYDVKGERVEENDRVGMALRNALVVLQNRRPALIDFALPKYTEGPSLVP